MNFELSDLTIRQCKYFRIALLIEQLIWKHKTSQFTATVSSRQALIRDVEALIEERVRLGGGSHATHPVLERLVFGDIGGAYVEAGVLVSTESKALAKNVLWDAPNEAWALEWDRGAHDSP